MNKPITNTDDYVYPLHMSGSASGLYDQDIPEDVVSQLHAVVEEVTGKPVVKPEKIRMGFL